MAGLIRSWLDISFFLLWAPRVASLASSQVASGQSYFLHHGWLPPEQLFQEGVNSETREETT